MDLDLHLAYLARATLNRGLELAIPMLLSTALAAGAAEPVLIDDFNDGNDDGWFRDEGASQPFGPAIYDASSGDYRLASMESGQELPLPPDTGFGAGWAASFSDPLYYSNGLLRTRFRIDGSATHFELLMRGNEVGVDTWSWYAFGATSLPREGDSVFIFRRQVAGVSHSELLQFGDPGLHEEWMLEAGAVGDRLTMKWWPVEEPEPSEPQWEWIDPDPLPPGGTGAHAFLDGTGIGATGTPPPWRIDATFDDLYFTPLIPGDYNDNGIVEQGDLDLVLLNWGDELRPDALAAAGWHVDLPTRLVDQGELDRILTNWGRSLPSLGAAGVPEPSAIWLACLGVPALLLLRRIRRNRTFAGPWLIADGLRFECATRWK